MYDNLIKNPNNYRERNLDVKISFNFGARVDLSGFSDKKYRIEFWNDEKLEYQDTIGSGFFAATYKKYFVEWKVRVYDQDELITEEKMNLKNRRVYVMLDSRSLGDTIAWIQQAIEFGKVHECDLYISTFYNDLFAKDHPNVHWLVPDTPFEVDFYAAYKLGYFYSEEKYAYTPIDPRTVPLAKVASDILQIPYEERKPVLTNDVPIFNLNRKYVCIAMQSTADAKHWHRVNGWQDVVDYLKYKGYEVLVIQKEPHSLKNVISLNDREYSLNERISQIKGADFFIGIGSGLSWLAWACNIPVIMISGFSESFAEFDCERIINKKVCHGCWNDIKESFDKTWNWCPRQKNFECTKELSVIEVIKSIDKLSQL
jgi:autotransporter strand-loop-strand O-heptosyltransferase